MFKELGISRGTNWQRAEQCLKAVYADVYVFKVSRHDLGSFLKFYL